MSAVGSSGSAVLSRPRRGHAPDDGADRSSPSEQGQLNRLEGLLANRWVAGGLFAVVVAVAVLARIQPWLRPHDFGGVLAYDDGVSYAAADNLLHGVWPYRDFVDLQAPLDAVAGLPFALVGTIFGDRVGMEVARLSVLGVSIANVTLLWRYLVRRATSRYRTIVAFVAALVYAVFPASVAAEHTLYLEPTVDLCMLIVGTLLLSGALTRRRCVAVGVVLAAAMLLKMVAAAIAIAAIAWLLLGRRRREATWVAGGLAGAGAVISLPFFLEAPKAFFQQVVQIQITRPRDGPHYGSIGRLSDLLGPSFLVSHNAPDWVVVLTTVGVATGVVVLWRASVDARFWLLAGVVILVGFMLSHSYFPHYADLLTPVVAVSLGYGADFALGARRPVVLLVLVALTALVGALAYGAWLTDTGPAAQGDIEAAGAIVPKGACVYTPDVSFTIAADLYRPPSPSCPMWTDPQGEGLALSLGHYERHFYPDGFKASAAWQRDTLHQLQKAQFLFLQIGPRHNSEWTKPVQSYAVHHFHRVAAWSGPFRYQVWARDHHRRRPHHVRLRYA